jgi:hypothetical protein
LEENVKVRGLSLIDPAKPLPDVVGAIDPTVEARWGSGDDGPVVSMPNVHAAGKKTEHGWDKVDDEYKCWQKVIYPKSLLEPAPIVASATTFDGPALL